MKRSTAENKLDALWRSVGKEGAVCAICATLEKPVKSTQLHPHHIIGRAHKLTRWDLRNRIWVCPYHHTFSADMSVQTNLAGWFWKFGEPTDWLSLHLPETKAYLESIFPQAMASKKWTLQELEDMISNFPQSQ